MQLRCTYCQTMFAMSREEMLAALEHMEETKQIYHDSHCPKCRRANRVERAKMERFFPDWKTAIKTMEKASAQTVNATGKMESSKEAPQTKAQPKIPARAEKKAAPKPKTKLSETKKK
jgi:hypothetical protein